MKKLNGNDKIKTAVFISGKGSNLKSIIKNSIKKDSKFKIELVISNNPKAEGLNHAIKYKIKKDVINYKNIKTAESKILYLLKKNQIRIVCLAGFMKILSRGFIDKFKGKILNIHPSLLPKYKGLNTHQRVINKNEKYSGCTVHLVSARLDSGKIILQKKVKISKNETKNSLAKKVLVQEHKLYPKAILKVFNR